MIFITMRYHFMHLRPSRGTRPNRILTGSWRITRTCSRVGWFRARLRPVASDPVLRASAGHGAWQLAHGRASAVPALALGTGSLSLCRWAKAVHRAKLGEAHLAVAARVIALLGLVHHLLGNETLDGPPQLLEAGG